MVTYGREYLQYEAHPASVSASNLGFEHPPGSGLARFRQVVKEWDYEFVYTIRVASAMKRRPITARCDPGLLGHGLVWDIRVWRVLD